MNNETDKLSKYQGALYEFQAPGTFEPVDDMTGGGVFQLEAGQWTDDTSMALCIAESLTRLKDFNEQDQLDNFLMWKDSGYLSSNGVCFDIGGSTAASLESYRKTGKTEANDPDGAGNGSLMRLAPVVLQQPRGCN